MGPITHKYPNKRKGMKRDLEHKQKHMLWGLEDQKPCTLSFTYSRCKVSENLYFWQISVKKISQNRSDKSQQETRSLLPQRKPLLSYPEGPICDTLFRQFLYITQ